MTAATRRRGRPAPPRPEPVDPAPAPRAQEAAPARVGLATVGEAAEFLRVCEKTVKRLVARGDLPSVKLGACRRVPWKALLELAGA